MIKNMITYFKLGKYIDSFKYFILCGLILFASGLLYFIVSFDNLSVATMQMTFGLNFIILILSSSIFNQMIGSSPLRRFMEITAPNIINVISSLFIYIILCISTADNLDETEIYISDVIEGHISGVFGILLALFFMLCIYKHMIVSTLLVIFAIPSLIYVKSLYTLSIFKAASLTELYVKGFILLVIGLVLCITLRYCFEKHSYMSIFEKQTARRI